MSLLQVPSGKNFPKDIYVIIEISSGSNPIKYEIDIKTNNLFVDRIIPTTIFYPCNYGYINNTLSLDNDTLDVLVPTIYPLYPKSIILCRPIGILKMNDESGIDNKIIAVPHKSICKNYNYVKEISDLPKILISQISYFFEHYKDLEDKKWVKIDKYYSSKLAKQEILEAFNRYKFK